MKMSNFCSYFRIHCFVDSDKIWCLILDFCLLTLEMESIHKEYFDLLCDFIGKHYDRFGFPNSAEIDHGAKLEATELYLR